ncbi:MAG: hypothetical protein KDC54_04995 [Lewinella sp.]|nr:hypothetical protein [Lewinella sp.]
MIDHLPVWLDLLFVLTCIATIAFFHFANGRPWRITGLIIGWSVLHGWLAWQGFYQVTDGWPPRLLLVLVPNILIVVYALLPRQIDWVSSRRHAIISTYLHTVRIPVEITLYYLYLHEMVPELMTFAGRNFDILIGLSAPVVAWLASRRRITPPMLLAWNWFGLILVSFIVINGILSAELPFQQFAFDQPNRAVTFFPYILLPAMIVPIVIYSHISDIILIRRNMRDEDEVVLDTGLGIGFGT